ncbi:MAG TPA: glycosyl hydrolase, partial [Puia sp.]|nr:glycosyl hydrolase [Puia sp.]
MRKILLSIFFLHALLAISKAQSVKSQKAQKNSDDPEFLFLHPPESAKPGVLWMWMGSNLSKSGITKDLEALRQEGFSSTTMLSLADVVTPWANEIGKSPTPQFISWTEPWWDLVKYAAKESKRLGMDFGIFNGPSYETSGGPWITPELSMQEVCWSSDTVHGGAAIIEQLPKPKVDPRANEPFPLYNPNTGLVEKPEIEARKTYYRDIAVLAAPSTGPIEKNDIIDLTDNMSADGKLTWNAPAGAWVVYRFGHTTTGALIQPAQWKATGLECDKMSLEAVPFHINHVLNEIKKHLGDYVGNTFSHIYFDSYEAGWPTWTPRMKEEFFQRRGYDITPWLIMFTDRRVGSKADSVKFVKDFDSTVKDLYRDVYFKTISEKLKAEHIDFLSEPYGGPWTVSEVVPFVHRPMVEFWTHAGKYWPYLADETLAAIRKSGQNIIQSE